MIEAIHINQPEWDEAVKKCPVYDVFCLNSYMKAFQMQGSGEPVLLVYSDGEDYAINSVFFRDIAEDGNFRGMLEAGRYHDVSAPYGYGGFLGKVSDWDKLDGEWVQWCRDHDVICEFERFNLFSDFRKHFKGEAESRTHNVVRSLDLMTDELWMDFKPKVRKNVKRANKYGLKIIIENQGKYLDDFLRIYYGTMERTDAEEAFFFKKEFFETLNQMRDNICYFHVVYHDEGSDIDKVISTELVIYGAENAYSYLGGTDRDYFDMRPNDFLKWEIINWAKEKGLKNFVLGGGYGTDDGIFEYKKCLAPKGIVDFYIGGRVFDHDGYKHLIELRKATGGIRDDKFFPVYRG